MKIAYKNKVTLMNDETIPNESKVTADDMNEIKEVVNNNANELETKQGKEEGKGLSTNDFTDELKEKLESLENYDDTELKQKNTEQDTTIEELKAENIELKAENERLNNDINAISVTEKAEGENITLNDTAEARFKKFGIGGNSWQETREGYNLIPFTYETKTVNGVTFTVNDDGTIKVDGTATANTYFDLGKPTLPAGDYILTGLPSVGSGTTFKITFKFEDTQQNLFGTDGKTFTINSEATAQENYLFIASGYTASNLVFKPMIAKGTTVKDYEQYGVMPSPNYKSDIQNVTGNANVTVCNKNVANLEIVNSQFRVTTEKINANTFKVTRTATGSCYGQIEMNLKKNTTYTVYFKCSDSNAYLALWNDYNGNNYIKYSVTEPCVFTTTQEKLVIGMYLNPNGTVGDEATFEIMIIESSNTDEVFAEHKEQSFTFPLVEGQKLMKGDYLADDGIHHVRKQRTFDGTETVTRTVLGSYILYAITISDMLVANTGKGLCSHYTNLGTDYVASNIKIRFGWIDNKIYFYTNYETVEEFQAYLAEQYANGTPVVVEYDLAEEEIEAYTEEQQAVYDEIKKTAHSYGEQTHIFCTDETSLIFSVEARKDMNTLVTRIEKLESEV